MTVLEQLSDHKENNIFLIFVLSYVYEMSPAYHCRLGFEDIKSRSANASVTCVIEPASLMIFASAFELLHVLEPGHYLLNLHRNFLR